MLKTKIKREKSLSNKFVTFIQLMPYKDKLKICVKNNLEYNNSQEDEVLPNLQIAIKKKLKE